jgi:DNA-directed RNA polymerase subunit RPC12/RpoP
MSTGSKADGDDVVVVAEETGAPIWECANCKAFVEIRRKQVIRCKQCSYNVVFKKAPRRCKFLFFSFFFCNRCFALCFSLFFVCLCVCVHLGRDILAR